MEHPKPPERSTMQAVIRDLANAHGFMPKSLHAIFVTARIKYDRVQLSLSLSSVKRFLAGYDIPNKHREIEFLYSILVVEISKIHSGRSDEINKEFKDSDLPNALTGYFSSDPMMLPRYAMGDVIACLHGEFIMYRRDFAVGAHEKSVRASNLNISVKNNSLQIEEKFNCIRPEDQSTDIQHNIGHIFIYADFIYFLTKEIKGSSIQFGVIDKTWQNIEMRRPVIYIFGHIVVNSRDGNFPNARFACARREQLRAGIIKLEEVPSRIRSYLQTEFETNVGVDISERRY